MRGQLMIRRIVVAAELTYFTVVGVASAQMPVKSVAELTADSLLKAGDPAAALSAYQRLTVADSLLPRLWMGIGNAANALHRDAESAAAFERAAGINGNPIAMYNAGAIHARMGHVDEALRWLDKAVTAGFPVPSLFATDADLAVLRSNPRFQAIAKRAQVAASPCLNNPKARMFDFWVGEWDVTPANAATVVGHSVIQVVADGCALLENWTAANGSQGKSLNVYNQALGHWQQFWVGGGGDVTEFRDSEWHGDTLVLLAHSNGPQGRALQRLSFSRLDANTVRQLGENSSDGGTTWSVGYDFHYHRRP
jgi:Tetratricopeptide repeat